VAYACTLPKHGVNLKVLGLVYQFDSKMSTELSSLLSSGHFVRSVIRPTWALPMGRHCFCTLETSPAYRKYLLFF
jgi:hypothetical protein